MNRNLENMKKCPSFNKCSQNLCPLDYQLSLRSGGEGDKCRWMREPKRVKIRDREFVSGGSVMLDALLNFVSQRNLKWLNESSRKRFQALKIPKVLQKKLEDGPDKILP